jgi:hypothetical protein
MNLLVPALFFAIAWILATALRGVVEAGRLNRTLGVAASGFGFLWLLGVRIATPHHWQGDLAPLMLPVLHLALSCIAYLAVPRRVLERPDTSLLLVLHGLILTAFVTSDLASLMVAHALATGGVLYLAWLEPGRHLLSRPLTRVRRIQNGVVYRHGNLAAGARIDPSYPSSNGDPVAFGDACLGPICRGSHVGFFIRYLSTT